MPRYIVAVIFLITAILANGIAAAEPDREALLEAWQAHIASLPSTTALEPVSDGVFRYIDSDLPYDGELKIVGVLIRNVDAGGYASEFTHVGMVEFELSELPMERMSSQLYYYWLTDRQSLHYSKTTQSWVDPATYQETITEGLSGGSSYGAMSFMMNYGIWIFLIGLIIYVFVAARRQMGKSRSLLDETAAINAQARENIDRAKEMQDELLEIARDSRDLQAKNNALLKEAVEALKR
ncbi:MAG: hypothetical protein HKN77_10685 [Woeseiaceae bacterium]|nr:hypothetical protein [Woeseiaceae bacterium]